jgi:hypothetical protein
MHAKQPSETQLILHIIDHIAQASREERQVIKASRLSVQTIAHSLAYLHDLLSFLLASKHNKTLDHYMS